MSETKKPEKWPITVYIDTHGNVLTLATLGFNPEVAYFLLYFLNIIDNHAIPVIYFINSELRGWLSFCSLIYLQT